MSLIVRVTVAQDGVVHGVVERPRTGEKHRFASGEDLAVIVTRMAQKATEVSQP
jgi:hypothetical protein